MDGWRRWGRNRVVLGALVVLLVAGGLVLGTSLRANNVPGAFGAPGTPPILGSSGVRFRIVGEAPAQPNPESFVETSYVVPNNRAVTLTDVVLQNPRGDAGTMRIQIGNEILLEENLATLRDQHYPVPLQVKAGQPVVVAVSCQVPGPPEPAAGTCIWL